VTAQQWIFAVLMVASLIGAAVNLYRIKRTSVAWMRGVRFSALCVCLYLALIYGMAISHLDLYILRSGILTGLGMTLIFGIYIAEVISDRGC
jgi:CDP-diglyceride synthetase